MKKLVLSTAFAMAVSGLAFAQGSVNWGSIPTSAMSAQTNSTAYSPFFPGYGTPSSGAVGATTGAASLGTGYYYALLYTSYSGSQATIPTLASLFTWQNAGLQASNSPVAFLAGDLTPVSPTTQATVPWAAGTTDSIVLAGWSANLGSTWGAVSNMLANWSTDMIAHAFFGVSATGYIAPNSANPGGSVFAGPGQTYGLPIDSLNTQLYALPVVPEPATMALVGLGGLSLMLFRRQRKN